MEFYAYINGIEERRIMNSLAKYKLCGLMAFGLSRKKQADKLMMNFLLKHTHTHIE
jgi:hypothetical protein